MRSKIHWLFPHTRTEFRSPIGLFIPALPGGKGGNAQSGGGAGGGPFTRVGKLLLLPSTLGLASPFSRCIGDLSEPGAGDLAPWLSVSLETAGDGRSEDMNRGDLTDFAVNDGENEDGETVEGWTCMLVGRRRFGIAVASIGSGDKVSFSMFASTPISNRG